MFTGIVETIGIVTQVSKSADCIHLTIKPEKKFSDLQLGDSVSINGVCLTVTELGDHFFLVTLVPETLRLTNLQYASEGMQVNLERSLLANSRLSGHYMQGHVDGMGDILSIEPDGKAALLVKISIPTFLAKYIVNKGYIGLDGMSITVIEATPSWISVTFIPFTQQVTLVNQYQVGSQLNIEVDIVSKYVEKLLGVTVS